MNQFTTLIKDHGRRLALLPGMVVQSSSWHDAASLQASGTIAVGSDVHRQPSMMMSRSSCPNRVRLHCPSETYNALCGAAYLPMLRIY